VHLLGQNRTATLNFNCAVDGSVERVQRLCEAPRGGIDQRLIGHGSAFVLRRRSNATTAKKDESANN
jgi:hypothetical protein